MTGWQFRFEPAVWLGLVRAVLPMLILFGLIHWTPEQLSQVFMVSEVGLMLIQRSVVTPNASLKPSTIAKAELSPPGPPA